jgi:tubulin--tyrosine ligase
MQEESFRDRDFILPIKEKILMKLWDTINESNDLIIINKQKKGYSKLFKYAIGKGNNGHMIRGLMAQRWWWQSHSREKMAELNFLWTQWKVESQLEKLPSKIPKIKDASEDSDIDKEDHVPTTAKTDQETEASLTKTEAKLQAYLPCFKLPLDSKKLYNRLEDNFNLTSKKYLYLNMKEYYESINQDVFSVLPVTFHVKEGEDDPEFKRFANYYQTFQKEAESDPTKSNVWIIKPGENSNRGKGISVSDSIDTIKETLNSLVENSKKTTIIQKYIDKPLLINKRKFDIRIFALITCYNEGYTKGFYYNEGYLRTS